MSTTYLTTGGRVMLAKLLAEDRLIYTRAVTSSDIVDEPFKLEYLPNERQTAYFLNVEQVDNYAKLTAAFNCKELKESYQLKMLGIYAKTETSAECLYKVVVYKDEESAGSLPAGQDLTYRFIIIDSIGEGNLTIETAPDAAAPLEHVSNANRHIFTQINNKKPALVDSGEKNSFSDGQRIVFVPKIALSSGSDTISCAGTQFLLKAVDLAGKDVDCVFLPHKSYVLTYSNASNSFIYVKHNEIEYVDGVGHFWDGAAWKTVIPAGEFGSTFSDILPAGTLLCDGASLSRNEWPELFEALGTKYGAADEEHFSLPNAVGRCIIGAGTGYELGSTGGEAEHVLTERELPRHKHSVNANTGSKAPSVSVSGVTDTTGDHYHYSGVVNDHDNSFYLGFGASLKINETHYAVADDKDPYGPDGQNYPRTSHTSTSGEHRHPVKLTGNTAIHSHPIVCGTTTAGYSEPLNLMQPYVALNTFIYTGKVLL